jgi:hypothetical protein
MKKLRFTLLIIFSLITSNLVFSQINAIASSTMPLIEIQNSKTNKLLKTIKTEEPVFIINISEDNKYVFAHSQHFVYRINIETEQTEKIEFALSYSPTMEVEQETSLMSRTKLTENGVKVESNKYKLKEGKSNKIFYHSNELHQNENNYNSRIVFLRYNNASSTDVFFYISQSWMNESYKLVYESNKPFYKFNFKTLKVENLFQLDLDISYGFALQRGLDKSDKSIFYTIDLLGTVKSINVVKQSVSDLFQVSIPPEFNRENTFTNILGRNDYFYVAVVNLMLKKAIIRHYDKRTFKKTKEITREGDAVNTIESRFDENHSIWYYSSTIQYNLPSLPVMPKQPTLPTKYKGKSKLEYDQKVEDWTRKCDSINNQYAKDNLKYIESLQNPKTTYSIFSDEELTNQIFQFSNASMIQLISADVLRVTYTNQKVEEYNITTKELIKTTRKKATSIDDF